jgi:hypothetical protein
MSDLRDDLLFSDALKNLSCNSAEILFDKSYEDKNILVDITYFYLSTKKVISTETTIEPNEELIGVGYDEAKQMINLYKSYSDTDIFFWANIDEIGRYSTSLEQWSFNEVKRHNKAIKENWVTIKK